MKFSLLVTFLIIIIVGLKSTSNLDSEIDRFNETIGEFNEQSVVFLGSSRIRKGINDSLLNQRFPKYQFYNLGIASNTLLPTYLLTKHLISATNAKIIFVELSPFKTEYPSFSNKIFKSLQISASEPLSLVSEENELKNLRLKAQLLNSIVFNKISLKNYVKSLIEKEDSRKELFGHISSDENKVIDTSSILKIAEIKHEENNNVVLNHYLKLIDSLLKNSGDKKIIFLLPVTYRKVQEKKIMIQLYFKIPEENKISLDTSLLASITNKEYLEDILHFNSKGAAVYTNELARLMTEQGLIPPPTQ